MKAEPMGVENLVEPLPIGMRRAEQRSECGPQRGRSRCNAMREDRECITRFRNADLESVVAQRARKARKHFAHRPTDFFNRRTWLCGNHRTRTYATFPRRRSLTSRVSRARSSWVLSKHIIVS